MQIWYHYMQNAVANLPVQIFLTIRRIPFFFGIYGTLVFLGCIHPIYPLYPLEQLGTIDLHKLATQPAQKNLDV